MIPKWWDSKKMLLLTTILRKAIMCVKHSQGFIKRMTVMINFFQVVDSMPMAFLKFRKRKICKKVIQKQIVVPFSKLMNHWLRSIWAIDQTNDNDTWLGRMVQDVLTVDSIKFEFSAGPILMFGVTYYPVGQYSYLVCFSQIFLSHTSFQLSIFKVTLVRTRKNKCAAMIWLS